MLGAAALVALLAFRLRFRTVPGALAPILLGRNHRIAPVVSALLAIAVWLAAHATDLLIADDAASAWLHRLSYLGIATLGPAAALDRDRGDRSRRAQAPMRFVAARRPHRHDLARACRAAPGAGAALDGTRTGPLGPAQLHPVDPGPWFWVHGAFSSACLAAALGMLARHYASLWPRYGQEAICVMLAIAGPVDLEPGRPRARAP